MLIYTVSYSFENFVPPFSNLLESLQTDSDVAKWGQPVGWGQPLGWDQPVWW